MADNKRNIAGAVQIIKALGFPNGQQNERSALCLLALLNITPGKSWADAQNPLIGIRPIMDWARDNYGKKWAENTRESVRRQTMHQFVAARLTVINPDDPTRATNSPHTVYQIEPAALALIKTYGTPAWCTNLQRYQTGHETLTARYAAAREQKLIPVVLAPGQKITLSAGKHNKLIRDIIKKFAARFAPGGVPIYVGDTGKKWAHFDRDGLTALGVTVDTHGKMPDVIIYYTAKNWLLLIEAVTSHGPVDGKRHDELARLFAASTAGLVYVTAFPDRATMTKYAQHIAWETEVWTADNPSHMIHFNGSRFLGPYPTT